MKKVIFAVVFLSILCNTLSAQSKKLSNLAKKEAKAICDCPSYSMVGKIMIDFKAKKISPEEFQEGIKMAGAQMDICMKPFYKEHQKMSDAEKTWYRKEVSNYLNEICTPETDKSN